MQYQLVVQFPAKNIADFDALVSLENELVSELGNSAKVDGHDFGSGEANIFILTSDPELTFWKIRQVLKREGRLEKVTAAYRPVTGGNYKVVWPKDSQMPFSIK